jgi:hypothetical protein
MAPYTEKPATAAPADNVMHSSVFNLDPWGTAYAVSPKIACMMLNCGITRIYQLMNDGKLLSYWDGRSRKVVVESIKAHIARCLAASSFGERKL